MAEVGKIHALQKLACSECRAPISDDLVMRLGEGNEIFCQNCGTPMKLPETVIQKIRAQKHVGINLDITA